MRTLISRTCCNFVERPKFFEKNLSKKSLTNWQADGTPIQLKKYKRQITQKMTFKF